MSVCRLFLDEDALHSEYLAAGKSHAGMILSPQQRYSIGEQMRRLLQLIAVRSAEEMRDRVEYLSHWQGRSYFS